MEQIFISEEILAIQKKYCLNLFSNRRPNFVKPIARLKELKEEILGAKNLDPAKYQWDDYIKYIENIIDNYDEILKLKPSQFEIYKNTIFSMLNEDQMSLKILGGEKKFFEMVVSAMRYEDVRDKEYASYMRELGIKSCIYCNAQYTIPTHGKGRNAEDVTTYEIDHFFPKSKYPFLCTTFFNLAPPCSSCNRRKNDNKIAFCLFSENPKGEPCFHFKLRSDSVAKYLITRDLNDLDFKLIASDAYHDSLEVFHLQDIYNEHKDIVEEIVWKHWVYGRTYRSILEKQFSLIFNKDKFLNGNQSIYRILFGTYPSPHLIHKRPLSLFIREIISELDSLFPISY